MEMEKNTLIGELTQGKELAIQLSSHFQPSSSSSQETCVVLTEKIRSSFEKALSMLNWGDPKAKSIAVAYPDLFANGRPQNDVEYSKENKKQKDVFKKRKLLPRWTEEVKACSGTGLEGPLNDGYSWRKYGQKDIHGANFPRCYYRCTHRNVQGCLATKQVQRSDSDPSIFEVTYRGRHTCSQSSHLGTVSISARHEATKETKENLQKHNPRDQICFDFGEEHKVKSEGLDDVFPSFCFPSSSIGSEIADNYAFYEPMMETALIGGGGDGGLSTVVGSPATSESNYFQAWDWTACGGAGAGVHRVQSSDQSDLSEIISAPTSVTNSPIGGWDFSREMVDFDPNFPLDNLEFFS